MTHQEVNDALNIQYTLINECKAELSKYDYIGVKIAMGVAEIAEYSSQISKTEELRLKINQAEAEVERLLAITEFDDDDEIAPEDPEM